ncbi:MULTISPECIES: heme exporter protein CcmD [unclassified Neptuniibacter]|jgi:heme exporter protein D|uniref:heme exporter protein CcmD n=1 Tax=unclassified Neptuniibacter TaxID=2630693 RepID=UPI000C53FCF8|nr:MULTISPECIES: heme exporter protein CcmD [unclassified Neptuniibacter]MAY42183.1 heme exporter protein CcmD [Oceanospirillaceae bacterium]
MSFESFSDFIAMGGHGFYVWLSYAIALVVIVINIVNPALQKKKVMSDLARRLRREKKSS